MSGTGEIVRKTIDKIHSNAKLCFSSLAVPCVPAGRPITITIVPLKQRAGLRVGQSRIQRPAGPCEAASSSRRWTTGTVPRTQPAASQGQYCPAWAVLAGPVLSTGCPVGAARGGYLGRSRQPEAGRTCDHQRRGGRRWRRRGGGGRLQRGGGRRGPGVVTAGGGGASFRHGTCWNDRT